MWNPKVCLFLCVSIWKYQLQANQAIRHNAQYLILFQIVISNDFKVDQTSLLYLVQMRYGAIGMQLYDCHECYKT